WRRGRPRRAAAAPPRGVEESPPEPAPSDRAPSLPAVSSAWPEPPSWKVLLLALWAAGSLGWFAVAGLRINHFRRLLRHARPAPEPVHEQARQLALRLGLRRCPGGWFVPAPLSPLLWALAGTARLLPPEALWNGLGDEQRATLLVHELAHLRRRDHWVRWLELLALGLYWWHPVVWWARHELREAEEQCCDAWVLWALPDAAESYARALV